MLMMCFLLFGMCGGVFVHPGGMPEEGAAVGFLQMVDFLYHLGGGGRLLLFVFAHFGAYLV